MSDDIWHFKRLDLAGRVVDSFDFGLASALTYFAPRRMGKTEFLRKDIMPLALGKGWFVFYYSFLETKGRAQDDFRHHLLKFALDNQIIKERAQWKKRIKKIAGQAVGVKAEIELESFAPFEFDLQALIESVPDNKKILLLLDEVQELAVYKENDVFLAKLRTILDINKDKVKAIFTGSSREGLRNMFSQSSAPFFHFGQNLDFPPLEKSFTDHLCNTFTRVTQRPINGDQLWDAFLRLDRVPQLARSLVERLALDPNAMISDVCDQMLSNLHEDRGYEAMFYDLSEFEQKIVSLILGKKALFAKETLDVLSQKSEEEKIKISTVQSTLRTLQRKRIIIKSYADKHYVVEDPNFASWLRIRMKV